MDIDIMSRQLKDLMSRVEALEGHPNLAHNPEGVVRDPEAEARALVATMEANAMTEERVKSLIAEHNQTARGAGPGGSATGDAGKVGTSSQVEPITPLPAGLNSGAITDASSRSVKR